MAYLDDDTESPSTGHISIMSDHHNADNDRLRLGRELARDFQSLSFSSTSSRGRHNNNKNNNNNNHDDNYDDDDSGTLDSFDISNDAAGMSTRKFDMLQQTPTIDTRLLDQFPDFSMAGRDIPEDSIEIGRANRGPVDDSLLSVDFSSQQPFSIGNSTRKSERRLFTNPDIGRKLSFSSAHSDPSEIIRKGTATNKGKEKARVQSNGAGQRLGSITNFDLSQIEISTPKNKGRGGQGGTKITDFVSNSGSGGSRSRFADIQRSLEFDDDESASEHGSDLRPSAFTAARFGSPKPRQPAQTNGAGPKRVSRVPEMRGNDLTDDLPAIVAKSRKQPPAKNAPIPQNFKSTDAFLHELGLDGATNTADLKYRLNQLKDIDGGKGDNTTIGITQQSYLLPQMSDLSELISGYPGDATRLSHKRGPFNNTRGHKPIESIPIPQDERAVLMAMRLLQDKVVDLESSKAQAEHRFLQLQDELRRSESRIRLEQQRAKSAEEALTRKHSGDSAFGGSDDGDSQERVKEKQKIELQMDKLKLENTINNLNISHDKLTRDLDTAKIALKHMQEERNFAVNSVAAVIANNEDLKISMVELNGEIKRLKLENHELGIRHDSEREEWKSREERLRRKIKEARDAALRDAATAAAMEAAEQEAARVERREQRAREKEAQRELQKEQERIAMEEQARIDKELEEKREQKRVAEQQKKVEKLIQQQLKDSRPDLLYTARTFPNVGLATSTHSALALGAGSKDVKGRATSIPRRSKRQVLMEEVEDETVVRPAQKEEMIIIDKAPNVEQTLGNDTVMSISPEEIKRIAKEINAERKKRKAATAAANAALQATEENNARDQFTQLGTKKYNPKLETLASSETQIAESGESSKKVTFPKKTVRIARLDKGKGIAEPEQPVIASSSTGTKPTVSFSAVAQTQTQSTQKKGKKTRLVKKVVFYYDEDTTQTIQLEKEVEEEVSEDDDEGLMTETIQPATEGQDGQEFNAEGLTAEFDEGLTRVPTQLVSSISELIRPPSPIIEGQAPELPERVLRVVNHLAEHDPDQCTVCARMTKLQVQEHQQRMQNPLADIDNSMAIPAPALEPASRKKGVPRIINGYEEEATPRPSQAPKRQLSKVVRQLSDEFAHLKLNYQTKVEEFMNLDPTIGKRRRKTLTNQVNELAAEMDYKCDQIYALYDVNEEFLNPFSEVEEEEEQEVEEQEVVIGRGESDDEDEFDLTGFTIPEMSVIDESTEEDDSGDEEERGRR